MRSPLADDRLLLHDQGGEAATVGESYRFRVKDFAAYYLGEIVGAPVAYHADWADRGRAIEALAASLP